MAPGHRSNPVGAAPRDIGSFLDLLRREGELAVVDTSDTYQIGGQSFFAPTNLTAMAEIFTRHPDAHILGGGTDIGILVSMDR